MSAAHPPNPSWLDVPAILRAAASRDLPFEEFERIARAELGSHISAARNSRGELLVTVPDGAATVTLALSTTGELLRRTRRPGRIERAERLAEVPAILAASRRSRRRKAIANLRRRALARLRFDTRPLNRLLATLRPATRSRGRRARPSVRRAHTAASGADNPPAPGAIARPLGDAR